MTRRRRLNLRLSLSVRLPLPQNYRSTSICSRLVLIWHQFRWVSCVRPNDQAMSKTKQLTCRRSWVSTPSDMWIKLISRSKAARPLSTVAILIWAALIVIKCMWCSLFALSYTLRLRRKSQGIRTSAKSTTVETLLREKTKRELMCLGRMPNLSSIVVNRGVALRYQSNLRRFRCKVAK